MAAIDDGAKAVLKDARVSARQRGACSAEPLDVLIAAIRTSPQVTELIAAPHQLTWEELSAQDASPPRYRGLGRLLHGPVVFSDETKAILLRATALAADGDVTARHLAAAALEQHDSRVDEVLTLHGTTADRLHQALLS